MSHTKEPWSLRDTYENATEVVDSNGIDIGELECFSDKDCRRIVACVNACAGMPTEIVENVKFVDVYNASNRRMEDDMSRIAVLEQQHSDLQALCRELVDEMEKINAYDLSELPYVKSIVKQALNKARGKL